MTNYFDNMTFFIRHTSMVPSDLDNLSWFEFEMLMHHLKKQLDSEAEQKKLQQQQQARQQMSMKAQMDQYLRTHKFK